MKRVKTICKPLQIYHEDEAIDLSIIIDIFEIKTLNVPNKRFQSIHKFPTASP